MKQFKQSILVPLESYLYLHGEQYRQRSGKHMPDRMLKRLERTFDMFCYKSNHMCAMRSGDLGGAYGAPENSYEEGRWTSWSVEDLKKMLDDVDLPWEDGPIIESITESL